MRAARCGRISVCRGQKTGSSRPNAFSKGERRLATGQMRPQEGTYLAYRQRYPLLRLLPGEHAHFGLWRKHRGFHGHRVGMRRDIIWQDQYRRLAIAHKIARDREDEVGI